jgi:tetratricopeptide (TPR) repeat protein
MRYAMHMSRGPILCARLAGWAAALVFLASTGMAQEHQHAPAPGEKLGTVRFATSCNAAAQPRFDRAVALLHSFQFGPAIEAFRNTLQADPSCAIAYWGIALSQWTNPFVADTRSAQRLQLGLEAVERGKKLGAKTERESAYLDAVSRLYADFEKTDQRTRVLAYEQAMSRVASAYPDDREASIFYALALAAAADPADKTYAKQLKAGAILERLFAEQPDHPGLAHYIIHSYDFPPLAPKAIDAARRYSKIAPSAPHALHMPSHTYTRVGYWQDSIDSNIAAGAAARREGQIAQELHTMDYRMYAYLQTAQDAAAERLLAALPEVASRFDPDASPSGAAPPSAGFFALAAIPARHALERRAWAEAAKLQPRPSPFRYTEANTYFVRGLGAAHTGDIAAAQSAIAALEQIRNQLTQGNEGYWAQQVEIQRRGVSAWTALAEGRTADALREMQTAADLEDGTEKTVVTPGPIAPARELLGEMLSQVGEPAQALKQFEATLKKEPNRFRATFDAAQAARLAGDREAAQRYYNQLLKICERADKPGRPELDEARKAATAAQDARRE